MANTEQIFCSELGSMMSHIPYYEEDIKDEKKAMSMWDKFITWCEYIGTARAADELARNGHFELAKKMILERK